MRRDLAMSTDDVYRYPIYAEEPRSRGPAWPTWLLSAYVEWSSRLHHCYARGAL